jgi:O-6-methylguanine DNA methyltransferase
MTKFQEEVWWSLKKIPKGRVTTYREIAIFLKKPRAFRAVGTAVGKNPDIPKVPCHRVVNSDGKAGQYSGEDGIEGKIKILMLEGLEFENGKVKNFEKFLYRFEK